MHILKYARRYLPLLILALLLIPIRLLFSREQRPPAPTARQPVSNTVYTVPENALYDVDMLSTQEGWAVGGTFLGKYDPNGNPLEKQPQSGQIWHYSAGSWSKFASASQPLLSLALASTSDGWAVGYDGLLLHYNGRTWNKVSSPTQSILRAVVALSPHDVWAIGFHSVILHYNGTNWNNVASPGTADLRSIFMLSPDDGWIAGDSGTLLHYHNQHWTQVASPTREKLNRVMMLAPDEGWAVGANGTILHYRAGTWEGVGLSDAFATAEFYDIALTSLRSGWIIGGASMLNYKHEVWSAMTSDQFANVSGYIWSSMELYSLNMLSANEGWAVGATRGTILLLHYQKGSWGIYG